MKKILLFVFLSSLTFGQLRIDQTKHLQDSLSNKYTKAETRTVIGDSLVEIRDSLLNKYTKVETKSVIHDSLWANSPGYAYANSPSLTGNGTYGTLSGNGLFFSHSAGNQSYIAPYTTYLSLRNAVSGFRTLNNSGLKQIGLIDNYGNATYEGHLNVGALSTKQIKQIHQIYQMGNSLTAAGTIESVLEDSLGESWHVNNCGVSGDVTIGMLARFPTQIINKGDAEYVIIMGGLNDCARDSSASGISVNLQAMYDLAFANGIKVIALTITPSSNLTAPQFAVEDAVNNWIKNTATNVDYVIDANALVWNPLNHAELNPIYDIGDATHLNTAGYKVIADSIFAAVTFTPNTDTIFSAIETGNIRSYGTVDAGSIHFRNGFTGSGGINIGTNTIISGSITAYGGVEATSGFTSGGALLTKSNQSLLNKAGNNWLVWAARDETGSEAVFNLQNIGTVTSSGAIKGTSIEPTGLTTGYIPYKVAGLPLANSPFFTDGTNISMGKTSPTAGLELAGGLNDLASTSGSRVEAVLRISGAGTGAIMDLSSTGNNDGGWIQARNRTNYATNYAIYLNPNGGNVIVGTTINGSAKFQVNGSIASAAGITLGVKSGSATVGIDSIKLSDNTDTLKVYSGAKHYNMIVGTGSNVFGWWIALALLLALLKYRKDYMKGLMLVLMFTMVSFAQEKTDSLRQVEIIKQFEFYQKQKASADSLSIGCTYLMQYLSKEYNAIEQRKKKK